MSGMKLASAGDDIKLWDVDSSFSMVKQFNPHDHNVSNMCWSHDNSYLSSVSNSSDKLSLTAVKNSSVSILDLNIVSGRTFVDFNSTSRYIVTGVENAISVWDLKVRSLRKTYKGHTGTVTCAKFNWNDTYIASGSDTGEIIVYNAVSGQGCSPMVAPKVQAVREIQYSQFKKSLLGSASDDGAINLWDTNTRRLIHSFGDAHRAPATGISFSPINCIFLMSVGLDKRIICYDIEGKKSPIKVIVAESPLTSIDTMPDGATIAVGSTRGKIYFYDLRQGDAPFKVINAHKASVQCLRFTNNLQNDSQGKSGSKSSSSSKDVSPPNRRQLPQAPEAQITVRITDYGPRRVDSALPDNDTFSPVQDTQGSTEGDGTQVSNEHSNSYLGSFLRQDNHSSSGVFSPLANSGSLSQRENIGISPLFTGQSPSTAWNNTPVSDYNSYGSAMNGARTQQDGYQSTSKIVPPSGVGTSSSDSHSDSLPTYTHNQAPTKLLSNGGSPYLQNGIPRSQIQGQVDRCPDPGQTSGYASIASPVLPMPSETGAEVFSGVSPPRPTGISASPSIPVLNSDDSPGSSAGADNLPRKYPSPEGVNAVTSVSTTDRSQMSRDPTITDQRGQDSEGHRSHDQYHGGHRSHEQYHGGQTSHDQYHGGQRSHDQASGGQSLQDMPQAVMSGNFQTQVLRNLIHDELEDFYDQIHKEVQNLQVEMIRQFQIHQNDVNQLLQHYSVNQDLVAEVEKLREENKRLKKQF